MFSVMVNLLVCVLWIFQSVSKVPCSKKVKTTWPHPQATPRFYLYRCEIKSGSGLGTRLKNNLLFSYAWEFTKQFYNKMDRAHRHSKRRNDSISSCRTVVDWSRDSRNDILVAVLAKQFKDPHNGILTWLVCALNGSVVQHEVVMHGLPQNF